MHDFTTGRAILASKALVYLAIAFGTLAFWADAAAAGGWVDYLAAGLLTVASAAISLLLSGVALRVAEARENQAPLTAWLAGGLGAVLGLIEAGLSLHGLVWIDGLHDFAPFALLVVAAFGLSAFNVFSLYAFAREIPDAKKKPSAELLMFGPNRNERRTLEEIGERLRAAGAM